MLKVIGCDKGVMEHLPAIFDLIKKTYGDRDILLYAVVDDSNNLGFVAADGQKCLYINNNGHRLFTVDENLNLNLYYTDKYRVHLKGDQCFVDKEEKEYRVSFLPLDEPDEDYTGEVLFNQYDPKTDTFCQLAYHQMYMEYDGYAPIYSYHTKEPSGVYIEEHNKEDHDRSFGLIHPAIQNYNMYTFEKGTLGFNKVMIRDYGLIRFLTNSEYEIQRTDEVKKYVKSAFMFNGQFHEAWPFCRFHDTEEIDELIKKYGFHKEIPQEIIEIYNNQDRMLRDICEILGQLKQQEIREDCSIKLRLVPDAK